MLSADNLRILQKWMADKSLSPICPACGANGRLVIFDAITPGLSEITETGAIKLAKKATVPLIPLTCENCGYTRLYSAVVIGLVNKEASKKAAMEDAISVKDAVASAYRERHPGGCKMASKGSDCGCFLCWLDTYFMSK